ncbi:hypothetical protein CAFE_10470 [Caprobacter fermentans]|uniref:Uncharacterized protein n=1 Tax=Caproicibacter fermentans TaxID=2576756 RepID=A0A6N8HXF4_9FIRM|nr:DUF5711 family protein [Caproicibacter fermentans]MVB10359.1 hypothetical protein [Caproicibacter fermentans]OCN01272.1 hypothetical protein A7X67_05725 [Clostridium sp. W14A]
MAENGRRFDTAEFDPAGQVPRRQRKEPRVFGEHAVPRWVYRIVLILILCVAGTLGWMNRDNLTPANALEWIQARVVGMGVGDGYPHSIAGTSVLPKNFVSADKNVYFASDTSLTVMNSTAKELVSRQHSFSDPVLRLGGNRMLLYNLGGRGCQLESMNRTVKKISVDQNIIAGALARQGEYALLTEADGYCGELTVYTADGREQFHYWFSDYYPTAVALDPDGTRAAVTGVNVANGVMKSAVYLLDLSSAKAQPPLAVYDGNMIFDVSWNGDSAVTAFGDQAAVIVNADSKAKTEYGYGAMQLTAYCSCESMTALGFSSYSGSSDSAFVVLDRSGKKILSQQLQGAIRSVSMYGSAAAALCGSKVSFYTTSPVGAAGTCDAGNDAKAVAMKDETSAYVLGVSEIRLVSVR